jgi:hypothetical protein
MVFPIGQTLPTTCTKIKMDKKQKKCLQIKNTCYTK